MQESQRVLAAIFPPRFRREVQLGCAGRWGLGRAGEAAGRLCRRLAVSAGPRGPGPAPPMAPLRLGPRPAPGSILARRPRLSTKWRRPGPRSAAALRGERQSRGRGKVLRLLRALKCVWVPLGHLRERTSVSPTKGRPASLADVLPATTRGVLQNGVLSCRVS